jgi:hypothetical protein
MSKKINIDTVDGGNDGAELEDLYFREGSTADQFNLYIKSNSNQITTTPADLTTGNNFSFSYNGFAWSITSFSISESLGTASGNWSATASPSPRDDDPETGTFQAQAGTGVDGEESASSAGAY